MTKKKAGSYPACKEFIVKIMNDTFLLSGFQVKVANRDGLDQTTQEPDLCLHCLFMLLLVLQSYNCFIVPVNKATVCSTYL